MFVPMPAINAVTVVPILAPIIRAKAAFRSINFCAPKACTIPIVTEELCSMLVNKADTNTPKIGFLLILMNKSVKNLESFRDATEFSINCIPINISPKPIIAFPMALILSFFERKERRNPKANIGKPKPVSLKAMIWAVAVVPMFAPNITPTVFSKLIVPELAKLTTIMVVAELDCMRAVNKAPRVTPNMGFDVILLRNFLNPVNAKISRFLLVRVIP